MQQEPCGSLAQGARKRQNEARDGQIGLGRTTRDERIEIRLPQAGDNSQVEA